MLVKAGHRANLSIPLHGTVDRGLFKSQIRKAECTIEEFIAALKS